MVYIHSQYVWCCEESESHQLITYLQTLASTNENYFLLTGPIGSCTRQLITSLKQAMLYIFKSWRCLVISSHVSSLIANDTLQCTSTNVQSLKRRIVWIMKSSRFPMSWSKAVTSNLSTTCSKEYPLQTLNLQWPSVQDTHLLTKYPKAWTWMRWNSLRFMAGMFWNKWNFPISRYWILKNTRTITDPYQFILLWSTIYQPQNLWG